MAVLLIALVPTGCAHGYELAVPPPPEEVMRFDTRAAGYDVVARLAAGDSMVLRSPRLEPGGLMYQGATGEELLPFQRVEALRFRSSRRGAGDGAGLGFLIGAGLGVVTAVGNLCTDCERGPFVLTIGAGFGALGALTGMILGTAIGATYEYRLP